MGGTHLNAGVTNVHKYICSRTGQIVEQSRSSEKQIEM